MPRSRYSNISRSPGVHSADAAASWLNVQSLVLDMISSHAARMRHLRMGVEDLLDLARKELLAAAIDDLLAPPDDLDIALVIDIAAEIAAAEPAVGGEGLGIGGRIVVVTEMHARPARRDLAYG